MQIEEIISTIENKDSISMDESFSIAKITSFSLRSDDVKIQEEGRKVIISILDKWLDESY